jgi:AAA+ superfamily predicted ATPase
MKNATQLLALLRSHVNGDEQHFYTIAMQIAAQEARLGHTKIAQELKDLVDKAKVRSVPFPAALPKGPTATPLVQPRGELNGLLEVRYSELTLNSMVLSDTILPKIERVIEEYRHQDDIRAHGLAPRRKILLYGPSGSGKTMTALALAGELRLPLFTIQLDALITKFMGETAAKLRLVFDQMKSVRGTYLFDEFDSIGAKRTRDNDVGEIRRVLNSFLQFIEDDQSTSIVIAATNHPEILDKALFRRFDDVIEYSLPAISEAVVIVKNRLAPFDTEGMNWKKLEPDFAGLSHAELARMSDDAAKSAILRKTKKILSSDLQKSLRAIKDKQLFATKI